MDLRKQLPQEVEFVPTDHFVAAVGLSGISTALQLDATPQQLVDDRVNAQRSFIEYRGSAPRVDGDYGARVCQSSLFAGLEQVAASMQQEQAEAPKVQPEYASPLDKFRARYARQGGNGQSGGWSHGGK